MILQNAIFFYFMMYQIAPDFDSKVISLGKRKKLLFVYYLMNTYRSFVRN